jgi:magnesium transporter
MISSVLFGRPSGAAVHRRHHKRYSQPGLPQGTLQLPDTPDMPTLQCRVVELDEAGYRTRELEAGSLRERAPPGAGLLWLDIIGMPDTDLLNVLAERFDLHPLALEDVINHGQRPKVDEYEDNLFTILTRPVWQDRQLKLEQVSLFLGEHFVVSFHLSADDCFAPVRQRLEKRAQRFSNGGAAFLFHALVDLMTDEYFPVLDALGGEIEDVELGLLDDPRREMLLRIHTLKRELLGLRRQLWPAREVVNHLMRYDGELLDETLTPYFKDVYDHGVYLIDLVEAYRDITAGMLDVYLSSVSYRLNDIMRVLTIIATIFIPLTFVTGIYGMNFADNTASPWAMPELQWYYGYPLAWLLIVMIAAGMVIFFKRKGWL